MWVGLWLGLVRERGYWDEEKFFSARVNGTFNFMAKMDRGDRTIFTVSNSGANEYCVWQSTRSGQSRNTGYVQDGT